MAIRELDIDRPVTSEEVAVIRWLLDNAPIGDTSGYRDQKLEELHVVGGCGCCVSVHFRSEPGHPTMIADATAKYPDGLRADLILWGKEGRITWLEVIDYGNELHRMPTIADLRRWEQYFDPDKT